MSDPNICAYSVSRLQFRFACVPIAGPVFSFVSHVRVKVFPLTRRTCGGVFACFVISIRMFVISYFSTSRSLAVSLSRPFD